MSFELFLTYQKMVNFWTYADESGTTLKSDDQRDKSLNEQGTQKIKILN